MSAAQRVAIVTGAAGGIGQALVRGLLGAGLRVAAVDRTASGLAALAASVPGKENDLATIPVDLAADAVINEIVTATRGRFGSIDILVNNAGIGQGSLRAENWQQPLRFWEVTSDQWRQFVHFVSPHSSAVEGQSFRAMESL